METGKTNTDDIITRIVLMPIMTRLFDDFRNISNVEFLKQSGYYSGYDNITEDLIRQKLFQFPECINEWMIWEGDLRTNNGFYFVETAIGWGVGYQGAKYDFPLKHYTRQIDACAWFIKHDIEDIRTTFPINKTWCRGRSHKFLNLWKDLR